mmetsp:Transcript_60155/g.125863  ORF Transcript_60155/g.125863 Transcript_60155/m.125863 type:complete len:114 (-) Transcript_60155:159-500(-)
MRNATVNSLSFSVLVAATINSTLSLTMNPHIARNELNAPPARRIVGYQCKNPRCGKIFANVFAYDQHRRHASTQGTLCASLLMRDEVMGLRRADTSTAALSVRPGSGPILSVH